MLELYDWYNNKGQSRGPGFLIQSIRNPAAITFPPGFMSSASKQAAAQRQKATKAADEQLRTKRERQAAERDKSRQRSLYRLLGVIVPGTAGCLETEALEKAEQMTRRCTFSILQKVARHSSFTAKSSFSRTFLRHISLRFGEKTGCDQESFRRHIVIGVYGSGGRVVVMGRRFAGWAGCEVLLRGWGNSSRQEATAEIGRE